MRSWPRLFGLLLLLLCQAVWALPPPEPGKLTVYFLDVGQGDAALLVSPAGKTVLVDGGPPDHARRTALKVASVVERPLDLVILSHPHLDHLGGLAAIFARVGARNFMDPGFDHPTSSYARLLEEVADRRIGYVTPATGKDGAAFTLDLGGGASLTVLWPKAPLHPHLSGTRSDANANSIVMRVAYGDTSFLFTGDAEADTESILLRHRAPLHATVLKVPHHGSRHSSQPAFIAKVGPKLAVISAGRDNDYGHPHPETLQRYAQAGVEVARTDLLGDLRVVSDGEAVHLDAVRGRSATKEVARVEAMEEAPTPGTTPAAGTQEKRAETARYVASRRSKVFHKADCPTVHRISKKNLMFFENREAADLHRRPAGDCHP